MKKSINKYKTYKAISKHEAGLLNAAEDFLVFSPSHIRKLLRWKKTTIHNTLSSLKKKELITLIKKNRYVLTSRISENIFKIATTAASPSYVSFWTASSYYGFTEQQIKTIQVVSTKQYPKIRIRDFNVEVTTYYPQKFYGYQKINNFPIAETEKLLIDLIYKPEKGGGLEEVKKCLRNMWPEIDEKKLLAYLKRFGNKSLFARLGYLLTKMELKNSLQKSLQKNLPLGYVRLNPQKKTAGHLNKKWGVIVND